MSPYSVRDATVEEQRELTQLCVRATIKTGYDEAFIDRVMPGLTITVPLIAGAVRNPSGNHIHRANCRDACSQSAA